MKMFVLKMLPTFGDAFCELCQPCVVQIERNAFNFGLLPSNRQTFSQENSMLKKTYFPRLADVALWHNCLACHASDSTSVFLSLLYKVCFLATIFYENIKAVATCSQTAYFFKFW